MIDAPFPAKDRVVGDDGLLRLPWINWFTTLTDVAQDTPTRLTTVEIAGRTSAIGATSFPLGALTAGLYRVSYFARITTPATTSSSLTVSIGFTNGTISCALSGAAMTGNSTATVQSGTFLVSIDASTPITYSTSYSSTGAQAMAYGLWLTAEKVDA